MMTHSEESESIVKMNTMTSTNIEELVTEISELVDERGIPEIPPREWRSINKRFSKDQIREALAHYITRNNPPFPMSKISETQLHRTFHKLLTDNMDEFIIWDLNNRKVLEKYDDYKYPFDKHGFALIELGHPYNPVSNYFQQKNRLNCGAYGFKAPMEIWRDFEALKRMNYTFWRLDNDHVDDKAWRGSFRLGSYTATQFKPHVAKCMYIMTKAKIVLDTSCGWGDRLAGFYTTPSVEKYFGCDPNENTFETYKEQCIWYETTLTGKPPILREGKDWFECCGSKYVRILRSPAEDINWANETREKFDCTFTSPPYFSTEKYNEGSPNDKDQSWSRYNEYEKWRDGFMFRMLDGAWKHTKDGGYVIINIMDPKIGSKRYYACDDMVDHMVEKNKANFIGQIGMRIKQRPKKMEGLQEFLKLDYIENVWCFGKGVGAIPRPNSLESFF